MNNEEKILAMLEKLNSKVDGLTGTVEKHSGMLAQIQEEQRQIRGEQQQMREEQQMLREEQQQMRNDIAGIKLRLELDVEKRFDAINEGIDTILEQMAPKSRVDALEADVVVLKSAVKLLSQEVAELKKAQ